MILVAGGTGMLGTLLCRRLRQRGAAVRVLTRDLARGSHLSAEGVEVVRGDLRDRASLQQAMRGVDTVVAAAHGFGDDDSVTPASVDRDGNVNLIDAARSEGAAVVLMSIVGAAADHPMELFRAKHAAEQHLIASGAPWTIVRATAFVETWAGIIGAPLRTGGGAMVFGRGENPINFVSVVDVAALLERATLDGSFRGQSVDIGGPANVTFNQLAGLVATSLGIENPPAARHIPRAMLRIISVAMRPFKPSLARHSGAAVIMDTIPMTFDGMSSRARFPDLALTDPVAALAAFEARPAARSSD